MARNETGTDGPTIYYTSRGERYVKAEELLRSPRGRDAVKRMADFANKQKAANKQRAAKNADHTPD